MDIVEKIQQRAMKMMKEAVRYSYKERLRGLGLFSLGEKQFRWISSVSMNS